MQHPWDNSTIFYQQVKEGGIIPAFELRTLVFLRSPLAFKTRETRVLNIFTNL